MTQVLRQRVVLVATVLMCVGGSIVGSPATAAPAPNACANPANFAGGTGTPADPYQVATADQLVQVADTTCMADSFVQTADIDLTGVAWSEIGTWVPLDPFTGSYDGGGFEIANLAFDDQTDPGGNQVGLFGRIEGATLTDIHLVDAEVKGWDAVGSLVGVASNTIITECTSANATVVGGGAAFWTAGGFAGVIETNSRVSDSWVTGSVEGVFRVGGFVGANLNGATIVRSTADVEVTGGNYLGGFAGSLDNLGSSMSEVSATGDVTGGNIVGGLVGSAESAIEDSRASGDVTGSTYVGGLVGVTASIVSRSRASGSVTAASFGGGMAGIAQSGAVLSEGRASGVVTAVDVAGGFVGVMVSPGTKVRRSWSTGAVTAGASSSAAGGFVGTVGSGTSVVDSFATGATTGPHAAGFAGRIENTGSVSRSYAVGAVTSADGDGFAHDSDGTVNHSFFDRQSTGIDSGPGTGLPTARMTTIDPFRPAGWGIVQDWASSSPPTRVWGICPTLNDGYPYLLWTRTSDDCPAAPVITASDPGPAVKGISYRFRIRSLGYPAPTFTIRSGTLPSGLTLDATTGVVSGIPTQVTTATIVVRAANASGRDDVTLDLTVEDLIPRAPRAITPLLAVGPGEVLVQTVGSILPSTVDPADTVLRIASTGPFGRTAITRIGSLSGRTAVALEHGRHACILTPGGDVAVTASGFLPGAVVAVYADPGAAGGRAARSATRWGRLVADASGRIRGSVPVPAGIDSGSHVLQLVGATDRNELRALSIGMLVDDAPHRVRDLTATRTSAQVATLTWRTPRGLTVAARSVVQLRIGAAGYVRVPTGSAYTLTDAVVEGLRAGCTYDARVRVVSPLGAGPWSMVRILAGRARMAPAGDVSCVPLTKAITSSDVQGAS